MKELFAKLLIDWYEENKRTLPWRGIDDPYKIWVSEIILQQTRVNQGWNYYLRFIDAFPTVLHLAAAEEQQVLKIWQGLGYYTRARNMHAAAKTIMQDYQGIFPDKYDDIVKLKGVGDYTAAAIASMAFSLPFPAVDGNVLRVISRIFGLFDDISSASTRKKIFTLCKQLMGNENPGTFNQAVMEFGALACTPQQPACTQCPFSQHCYALVHHQINQLPVNNKHLLIKKRFFYYFCYFIDNKIIIEKRVDNDIWKNLFQLPLIESPVEDDEIFNSVLKEIKIAAPAKPIYRLKHQLTHQLIDASFYLLKDAAPSLKPNQLLVSVEDLPRYPFPVMIEKFFSRIILY